MTMTEQDRPLFTADDVISTYTRAEAITDGVLVDVTETAKQAGWKYPVALTRAAWEDFVAWSDEDTIRKGWPQDEAGRLWDVLYMGMLAARRPSNDQQQRCYEFLRVPRDGKGHVARKVVAKIHCGPGDDGSPSIVISLPHED